MSSLTTFLSEANASDERAEVPLRAPHDPRLVERLRDGDVSALAELIRMYTVPLTRFAYDMVGSRDTAEDLVQAIFVFVWTARATLDPARSIKAYLYRAVRNRALNERKAEDIRSRYHDEMPTAVSNPEPQIIDAATVQAAMARLAPRRRLALQLRFEEGMTHPEIAEVLGVTAEAAKRLTARALADMRALLAPFYP